jgi:hypothetical protein
VPLACGITPQADNGLSGDVRDFACPLPARQAELAAAQSLGGVQLVDFADTFCTGSLCQSVIRGQVVYRYSNHLTSSFAQGFGPLLERQMDSLVGGETDDGATAGLLTLDLTPAGVFRSPCFESCARALRDWRGFLRTTF